MAGIGTGGTISGTGRYLKEASDGAVQVIGADPEGSIYSNPNDVHQYSIEGVGEDFYPKAFDRELPDEIVQVNDAEALWNARPSQVLRSGICRPPIHISTSCPSFVQPKPFDIFKEFPS